MVKAELVERIAQTAHLTQAEAKAALDAFLKATTDALKKGDNVKLEMFGTFSVGKRKEKKGVHPKTGEAIVIAAHKVVKFNASPFVGPSHKKTKPGEDAE